MIRMTTIHGHWLGAELVTIEAHPSAGDATLHIEGISEPAARNARIRVLSSLEFAGHPVTHQGIRVKVLPEPRNIPRQAARVDGAVYDLSIALAALASVTDGIVPVGELEGVALLGELHLGGLLVPMRGLLPALQAAARLGVRAAIVPQQNEREAAVAARATGIDVRVATSLLEVLTPSKLPMAGSWLTRNARGSCATCESLPEPDMADIAGLESAKRAAEIAAAGGHGLLLIGPPGSGRTMLARRLPSIMPKMTFEQALEVTAIHSAAGLPVHDHGLITKRPFRAPHHTVSEHGMVGDSTGYRYSPGEASLAQHGVLFLDELEEFRGRALDALHSELLGSPVLTHRALLVAADTRYLSGSRRFLSGQFDLRVTLSPVLPSAPRGEESSFIRARVEAAHNQGSWANAISARPSLESMCSQNALVMLRQAKLSEHDSTRVLRVAKTIADLAGSDRVQKPHVREAMSFANIEGQ